MDKNLEKMVKLINDTFLLDKDNDLSTTFKIEYIINTLDYCKDLAEDEDYATIDEMIYNICKVLEHMTNEEFDSLIKELNKDIKYYQDIDTLGQWYEIINKPDRFIAYNDDLYDEACFEEDILK